MERSVLLKKIKDFSGQWDVIVIGGGATGLGTALDATSRGFKTLVLEQGDFAQETSSKSTKLIHGGVRYLRQGRVSMVRESLKERSLLLENAPHLVHPINFFLPADSIFSKIFYYIGIKLYDFLAGRHSITPSHLIAKETIAKDFPNFGRKKSDGGVMFIDGQFDDSRLATNLAQTINEKGGCAVNYMQVQAFLKDNNKVIGVIIRDVETEQIYTAKAKVVINATGVFADTMRRIDNPSAMELIVPSQGAHIVLDKSFFPGNNAMIVPETTDGRVLFAIPWHKHLLVGTTDIALSSPKRDPRPLEEEIDYLLESIGGYLIRKPERKDILSCFAGLRPLIKPKGGWSSTAGISREFSMVVEPSGLITVLGGKWTTYRKMGQDTIDKAIHVAGLKSAPSTTAEMKIHGAIETEQNLSDWSYYGSDLEHVEALGLHAPALLDRYHPDLPCRPVDVIWAVRNEMARRLEDILSRRTRCLLLNARAALLIAPKVVELLSAELGKTEEWKNAELDAFRKVAERYIPTSK